MNRIGQILRKNRSIVAVAVMVSFFASSRAEATPLAADSFVVPANAGVFDPGTLLDSITAPFVTTTNSVTGIVRAAVYRNLSGFLDYYYQVLNDPTSITGVARVTVLNFGTFATSVAYRTDAFGMFSASSVNPLGVDRSLDGSTIGFGFGNTSATKVDAGEVSSVMMVSTDATQYGPGFANVINGGVATVEAFAPQVPEPASAALALLGALGLVARKRFA